MLCSQRAERATDCKQCKEAKASQEYSGKNSHCISEYILDAKAVSIYALRLYQIVTSYAIFILRK